ncbi:PQQ-binding-like beta-propeller repeat protein [Alienimonas sp. DA493]|uniref:PQQ-binding-like beta-propeller repeat protein n=1 Tax=Alienimonas sp. DA493 TaxID=3373605 RepID=UPI0037543240
MCYLSAQAKANGDWIRSTPALHVDENGDGLLFVAGIRDVLIALDAATGEERWRVDFAARAGMDPEAFGHVASPLALSDETGDAAVYVHTVAGFSKVDAAAGEALWTVLDRTVGADGESMMTEGAFSSPVAATIGGVPQILVQTRTRLYGVNPADGFGLWHTDVEAFRGMNILTPVVLPLRGETGGGARLLTSTYGGGTTLREVKRTDGLWVVSTEWENNRQGYMSSPVVIDGYVYQHLKNDRLVCYDLETGEAAWTGPPGPDYRSLVTDGARILSLGSGGELELIAADPTEFRLLDERAVTDATSWAHVAVTGNGEGGRIFVRALDALIAYEF